MYPKLEFRICKDGNIRVFCALEAFGSGLGGGGGGGGRSGQMAFNKPCYKACFKPSS